MEKLFSEFSGLSEQQWKEQIIKDLKGGEYDSLIWHTANGFDVKPAFRSFETSFLKLCILFLFKKIIFLL